MVSAVKKQAYRAFAGGNASYCKARDWWLDHKECSSTDLANYLAEKFSYLAGSGDETERARKVAAFLSKSEPYDNVSVSSISLLVSLFSLIISILSPWIRSYPETISGILIAAVVLIVVFMVFWAVIRHVTNRCQAVDTEFRGRLYALLN